MSEIDLEARLHDYYSTFTPYDSGRAVAGVGQVVADARARSGWNPGAWLVQWRIRGAAVVGVMAVIAVAIAAPLWFASPSGPVASPTATMPDFGPGPSGTYNLAVGNAEVFQAGMTRNGVTWAVFGSRLSISEDHGRTWRDGKLPLAYPGDLPGAGTVAVVDADHAWFIMSTTGDASFLVFRTSDGGATWQSAALPVTTADQPGVVTIWPAKLDFLDASVGFAYVETSEAGLWTVLRTLDGGASWTMIGTAPAPGDVVAVDANTLWVPDLNDSGSGGQPLLQVSRDAGGTWSDVPLPGLGPTGGDDQFVLEGPTGGVQFMSPAEGYIAVTRRTGSSAQTLFFGTTDGGSSWSQLATLPQPATVAPVVLDATHWYQIGGEEGSSSLGMWVTADKGQTWASSFPDNNWPTGARITSFWTVDGQNAAAVAQGHSGGAGEGSLFLTWDGGISWQPADFSAR
jgi:hypothetical protein